ncbi:hypothetical protein CDAR_492711 [Caerostris darwini]|uniref:Uncharacterized protein n=1 Tax=Caerostris darwini TaxID=1538125 RepID=A0AAV4UZK9_9ARAC|nr:hypothetical protein CDAR_492711 [Caerostris darwini]
MSALNTVIPLRLSTLTRHAVLPLTGLGVSFINSLRSTQSSRMALRNTPEVPTMNYSVDIHHSLYCSTSTFVFEWEAVPAQNTFLFYEARRPTSEWSGASFISSIRARRMALRNTPKVPAVKYSVDIRHSLYHCTTAPHTFVFLTHVLRFNY